MGFDFTEENKDFLNYLLFKFGPKLSIVMGAGLISSHFTKIDLTNYKKSTFGQMFLFLALEEAINSFVPKWKDEKSKKSFPHGKTLNPAKSFPHGKTLNPAKSFPHGKTLNPAYHISAAKTLNPAHHEL